MRFKKIPVDILTYSDEEITKLVSELKFRQFAQSVNEIKNHVFIGEKFLNENTDSLRNFLSKALEYLRPNAPNKR